MKWLEEACGRLHGGIFYFPPDSCGWQQDTGLAGLLALHIERGPQSISVVGRNCPKTLRYVSTPRESLPELHGLNAQDCYISPVSYQFTACIYLKHKSSSSDHRRGSVNQLECLREGSIRIRTGKSRTYMQPVPSLPIGPCKFTIQGSLTPINRLKSLNSPFCGFHICTVNLYMSISSPSRSLRSHIVPVVTVLPHYASPSIFLISSKFSPSLMSRWALV
jgi:hypothetical protein